MPRRPPRTTALIPESAAIPTTAMVASAVRFHKNSARIYQPLDRDWQRECYRHYAICGEARFAARFFGQALSRLVLSVVNDAGTPSQNAVDLLASLFKGKEAKAMHPVR